jgi:secreted trypsin-like serine protease
MKTVKDTINKILYFARPHVSNLAILLLNIGQDSCGGDSGGPLMTRNKTGKGQWFQVGLVSWGLRKCGTKGVPGVYTNVRTYLKWILDHIE